MHTRTTDADLAAYRRAFAAEVVSMSGDWFTYVAMSVLAAGATHGAREPWALLSVAASHTLPRWILAPLAGAACDRFDKRSLLGVTQSVRALIVATMAALALRPSTSSIALIHGLHLARMALGVFADTASRSALPSLVPEDRLAWAHARSGVAWSALFCVGVALGGVTVAAIGVAAAFAIDALSYAVAAALAWSLPPIAPSIRQDTHTQSTFDDAPERRALVAAIVAKVPAAIVQGALFIAIARYSTRLASLGAVVLGALHAARALGAGLGPYAIRQRDRSSPGPLGASVAVLFGALSLGALTLDTPWWIAFVLLTFVGLGSGASWVHSSAAVIVLAPAHARGRVAAIELSTQSIAQLAGSTLACIPFGTPVALALAALSIALLFALSRHR